MAAQARRLHLFIVSARGRRQNVCLLRGTRVCARVRERASERERRRGTSTAGGGGGGGGREGGGGGGERSSHRGGRHRDDVGENEKATGGNAKRRKVAKKEEARETRERGFCGGGWQPAPLTGWLAAEQSSCTLIRLVVRR